MTKYVQYAKIDQSMYERLCDLQMIESIEKIQARYAELKSRMEEITQSWVKVQGEDYYIFTDENILLPDTKKMKITWVTVLKNASSYSECLELLQKCSKEELKQYEKTASNKGIILPTPFESKILGLPAIEMQGNIAYKVFRSQSTPLGSDGYICFQGWEKYGGALCVLAPYNGEYKQYSPRENRTYNWNYRSWAMKLSYHQFDEDETLFLIAERYGIFPEGLSDDELQDMKVFHSLYKDGVKVEDTEAVKSYIINKNVKELLGQPVDLSGIQESILKDEIDLNDNSMTGAALKRYLDECDYSRTRSQKYNSRWYLSDEDKGHWDLWERVSQKKEEQDEEEKETAAKETSDYVIHIKDGVIARNPMADVNYDAVVGIDFGTKSTIVAVQNGDDNIVPMRVGVADYLSEPKIEHYENPTVMQFVNLSRFCQCYSARKGRPDTSWEDIKISHEAFSNMIASKESKEYASYVSDLKQWAAGRYGKNTNGRIVIRDKKGIRYDLNNYMELTQEDVDPIELYAYYLGIFINNMHTGIYLDYVLSFPETFSLEIRERILSSFRKGIKHALPEVIFDDEEVKAAFRVRQGPSEPAAYAACALEEFGIEPTDKGIFYGIFDFGGGTTDFDFGIWKNAPADEWNYNYVISHFGSGGDKSLGGENLLELLAYTIFSDDTVYVEGEKSNLQLMRENKMVFYRPEEGRIFPGAEALISTEESAILNTKQLMEVLRPIWEETELVKNWLDASSKTEVVIELGEKGCLELHRNGNITASVSLFDEKGNSKISLNLDVNMQLVNETLNERIEQGVRNFFEALCSVYMKKEIKMEEPIHIFLAGNSSKSKRVLSLFDCYMQEYENIMFAAGKNISSDDDEDEDDEDDAVEETEVKHFTLFPPLGTEEAMAIQEQKGIAVDDNFLMAPTGKTGVAFGLIMCREGSMIKVESELKKNEQIKMNYYIGINYRRNFRMMFDRNIEYNKWIKFIKATSEMETFEFYYTELPECTSGELEIKNNSAIRKKKCLLDKSEDNANVYFRFISPSQLEYVVTNDEMLEEGKYISSIYKVAL